MASYQVPPPQSFNFSKPEEWPNWIRRLQRFRLASGLSEKSSENQVNTLVYTMGDVADDILTSFKLTEEQQKEYDTVVAKFEHHFVKKRNVIFEWAKFNQCKQEEGESVDDLVTALYCLSEHCMSIWQLVRRNDSRQNCCWALRFFEKLQLEPELTLEKAVTSARQRESVKKQQKIVRAEESSPNIDAVHSKQIRGETEEPAANKPTFKQYRKANPVTDSNICTRCGKCSHFGQQQCPGRDATYRKCHRRGHFQVMYRTKSVRALSTKT